MAVGLHWTVLRRLFLKNCLHNYTSPSSTEAVDGDAEKDEDEEEEDNKKKTGRLNILSAVEEMFLAFALTESLSVSVAANTQRRKTEDVELLLRHKGRPG